MNKREIGALQEEKASTFLIERGYTITDRNFRSTFGEIDLIGWEGGYLCFIEVRFRSQSRYGSPEESVNRKKQERIIKTARYYLMKQQISPDIPCRFDLLVILKEQITLYQNAFETR